MAGIDNLQSVNLRELANQGQQNKAPKVGGSEELQGRDFGQTISDFISAVNEDQIQATKEATDVIQGRSENLHQAMASMEEAQLSFRLMIEVRNKLLESYQTLQRLQV